MATFLTKIAHNNRVSLGPKDQRLLHEFISSEKRLTESSQRLATDRGKSSAALRDWAANESNDMTDVLGKISILFDHYTDAEIQLAGHEEEFRKSFKSIRTREEELATLKRAQASLQKQIESQDRKVAKMKEENKDRIPNVNKLSEMRNELIGLDNTINTEVASLGDFKRYTTREAICLKLGAMSQLAEKAVIIAEIGKLIVEELPLTRTEPGQNRALYTGYERTEQHMQEVLNCLGQVVFNPAPLGAGHVQVPSHQISHNHMQSELQNYEALPRTENYSRVREESGAEENYEQIPPIKETLYADEDLTNSPHSSGPQIRDNYQRLSYTLPPLDLSLHPTQNSTSHQPVSATEEEPEYTIPPVRQSGQQPELVRESSIRSNSAQYSSRINPLESAQQRPSYNTHDRYATNATVDTNPGFSSDLERFPSPPPVPVPGHQPPRQQQFSMSSQVEEPSQVLPSRRNEQPFSLAPLNLSLHNNQEYDNRTSEQNYGYSNANVNVNPQPGMITAGAFRRIPSHSPLEASEPNEGYGWPSNGNGGFPGESESPRFDLQPLQPRHGQKPSVSSVNLPYDR